MMANFSPEEMYPENNGSTSLKSQEKKKKKPFNLEFYTKIESKNIFQK